MTESTTDRSRGLLDLLSTVFMREPQDKDQLIELLRDAEQRELLDAEALAMIESAMQLAEMQVRDVMTADSSMISVHTGQCFEDFVQVANESGYSRLPVFDPAQKTIEGILLVKDLLRYFFAEQRANFKLSHIIHPPFFVPESKRLDALLKEFRAQHNHMAIVIDEYGSPAGLVTIEDILEQIVGEIEDEHDMDEACIQCHDNHRFSVKAQTSLDEFNEYFNCELSADDVDTIGGLVLKAFGYLPKRGDTICLDEKFSITVLHADNKRLRLLEIMML